MSAGTQVLAGQGHGQGHHHPGSILPPGGGSDGWCSDQEVLADGGRVGVGTAGRVKVVGRDVEGPRAAGDGGQSREKFSLERAGWVRV